MSKRGQVLQEEGRITTTVWDKIQQAGCLGQRWAHSAELPALVQDVVWGAGAHREGTEAYSYIPRTNSLMSMNMHLQLAVTLCSRDHES